MIKRKEEHRNIKNWKPDSLSEVPHKYSPISYENAGRDAQDVGGILRIEIFTCCVPI